MQFGININRNERTFQQLFTTAPNSYQASLCFLMENDPEIRNSCRLPNALRNTSDGRQGSFTRSAPNRPSPTSRRPARTRSDCGGKWGRTQHTVFSDNASRLGRLFRFISEPPNRQLFSQVLNCQRVCAMNFIPFVSLS